MAVSGVQRTRRSQAQRIFIALALTLLLALVAVQTARYWRYFPMFMGDQGWFLQVAARISQGEALYKDVIWAYGPLSAQALAGLLRALGPNAGLATLINGLLAGASLLFTYAAVRSLLLPLDALVVVAFAAVTGGHMAGDLIRQHLLVYNQSVSWGMAASLAALAASLRWHQARRGLWLALAGAATGLAWLAKPEFGAMAVVVVGVLLASSRAPGRAWIGWLAAAGLVATLGLAWQAGSSGWQALLRGYTGYDMVAQGAFWGSELGSKRWLASVVAFWLAMALIWVGWRRPPRWLFFGGAVVSLGLGLAVLAPTILLRAATSGSPSEVSWRWWLSGGLQWLVAAPWALLTPLLIAAAWLGRKVQAPPPWWALWTFALLANLRLLPLGFSSGVAIAPALTVFAWLATARANTAQTNGLPGQGRWRRAALAILLALTAANLLAQALTPDVPARPDRTWLATSLGDIAIGDPAAAAQVVAIQAGVAHQAPSGDRLFAHGWGAGWYLLTGRASQTPFDVVLGGMIGPSGAETARLEALLLRQPPGVVILPLEYWPPGSETQPTPNRYFASPGNLELWWQSLRQDYVAEHSSDSAKWVVLWRR